MTTKTKFTDSATLLHLFLITNSGLDKSGNVKLRQAFIDEFNLCWLYCPDDVIKKGYSFFEAFTPSNKRSTEEKQRAMGEFVASIRRDLLSREIVRKTDLQGSHYGHFHSK